MTLEDVAVDLYGIDPSEFVAARAERVAAAKKAGDKQLAAAIGKLRKPTVTAWTVNLLARTVPDEVNALLALGDALRKAQRELSGDQLRALTAQRQQVVSALARRAGAIAEEHGKSVGENVLREVTQTLTAALADAEVAEQVRSGTLATAASYEGFGPAGPELVALDGGASPKTERRTGSRDSEPASRDTGSEGGTQAERKARDAQRKAREAEEAARRELDEARQELDDALEAVESARTALNSARAEAEQAARTLADDEARIEELRAELERAEQQRQFARTADRAAQDELRTAQRQFDRVERWARRARARVEDLS
ncbi:hypothetical protein IU444_23840 [Nocardia farcinica]|uniref:hypothetical protein n=1 Tax=Nocardia farcinica TaxID=37329 RepID=UPI0018948E82|nr:hypothetical protein [Nocardia farcinica]MBF6138758.1 hypothetical protein [Nocardia farcinica]MBF6387163.1 hypothetical protein [Nocardia farcinica]